MDITKTALTETEKQYAWKAAFIGVLCILSYKTFSYMSPFTGALFLAGLLAVFLNRFKKRLVARIGGKEKIVVTGIILSLLFAAVIPFSFSSIYVANKTTSIIKLASDETQVDLLKHKAVKTMEKFVAKHPKSNIVLGRVIELAKTDQTQLVGLLGAGGLIKKFGGSAINFVSATFSKIGTFMFSMIVMLIGLGVFMLNGEKWINEIVPYVPMQDNEKKQIIKEVYSGMNTLFDSMIAVGIGQGSATALIIGVYSIIYFPINIIWFLFLYFVLIFSSACGMSMAIPTLAGYILIAVAQAHYIWAVCLLVLIVPIASLDNLIKLKVLGDNKSGISSLLIMLFVIGGVMTEGMLGIISGPFFLILLVAVSRAFTNTQENSNKDLPKQESKPTPQSA